MLVGMVFRLEFDEEQNPRWRFERIASSLYELKYIKNVELDLKANFIVTVDPREFEVCEYKFSGNLMSIMESHIEEKFNLGLDHCFMGAKFRRLIDTDDESAWIVTELPRSATSNIRAYPYYRTVNTDSGAGLGIDRDTLVKFIQDTDNAKR